MRLAQRVQRAKPSATVSITALAAKMRAAGRDVIALSVGEPDFPTPRHICDAATAAIARGETKYTVVDGSSSLKQAIARKAAEDLEIDVDLGEILVSSGAKQSCFNACAALLEAGDEVVIPAPCWVSYPDMVRLMDGEPVIVHTDAANGFKMTPAQLAGAMTSATRALIVNSPCNPTGAAYTREEWRGLADVLAEHPKVVVVTDEIYEKLFWGNEPFCGLLRAAPELRSRVLVVNGLSKAYAMTGWRVGYAIGPVDLIDAMTTVQSQSTTNACTISQAAAVAALTGDQTCVSEMRDTFEERQQFVVARLNAMPGVACPTSDGTFYAFPDVSAAIASSEFASDIELCAALLEQTGVALVPGSAFAAPGFVRLSFAANLTTLTEALERIERFLVTACSKSA